MVVFCRAKLTSSEYSYSNFYTFLLMISDSAFALLFSCFYFIVVVFFVCLNSALYIALILAILGILLRDASRGKFQENRRLDSRITGGPSVSLK